MAGAMETKDQIGAAERTRRWGPEDMEAAAAAIRAGRLGAFPPGRVCGLGGAARSDQAVPAIFAAKARPRFNPLILHVTSLEAALSLAEAPAGALRLAEAFWPGPLTLVLPRREGAGVSALASAGLPSLALRAPAHPLAQRLLAAVGGPVAAPSANPSGRLSPTTADHVLAGLGGRIAGVLDGGRAELGLESAIVGFADGAPRLLREGGIPREALEEVLGAPLAAPGAGVTAPGQLASHYAPRAGLRLNAGSARPGERLLGFGPEAQAALNLSPAGDLTEAAANLFAMLHALDRQAGDIAVSPIPEAGLGRAINDRLRRAAAPRETP